MNANSAAYGSYRLALSLIGGACLAGVSGCAHYAAAPLALDRTGAGIQARTLGNDDLRQYLVANLGRDFSTAPAEWDFEALCWVAFYYNPSLELARAQWAAAQAGVRTAGARTNPTLTLTPGFNANAENGVSPWMPAVNFDFLLETSGQRAQRTALAKFGEESSRQNVLAAAWQVRGELRRALVELALAGARVGQLQAQADLQQRLADLLEQRLAAGAMARREVMAARLVARKAVAAVEEAARQIPLARLRVAQVLGLPVAAIAELKFALPAAVALAPGQIMAARRAALQARADVLVALARFEASQTALEQ
ncbi:MAG: TolC family protein, partial [Undibacterium sp.]|nr:TolC family protein [Opitutaceae bacterium]